MAKLRQYLVAFLRLPVVRPVATALLASVVSLFVPRPRGGKFTVMQVGGRGGPDPYTKWLRFSGAIRTVGVEPESSGIKKLEATKAYDHILTQALSDKAGMAPLYITKAKGWCSLRKPDEAAIRRVATRKCLETRPFEVVGTENVELTTFDSLKGAVPAVDYLQIDVQGWELQVLRGALQALPDIGIVELEVRFFPLYEDEPLFPEIDAFFREHGFGQFRMTYQGALEFGDKKVEANACYQNLRLAQSQPEKLAALREYAAKKHEFYTNKALRLLCDIHPLRDLRTHIIQNEEHAQ